MINVRITALTIVGLGISVLIAMGCEGQTGGEVDLRALEMQRYSAIESGDAEALDAVLDDNLIFTHASGKIDSKESFISSLTSGNLTYNKIDLEDVEVRLYEKCGVVTGKSSLNITVKGEDRKLELLFTTVWVSDRSEWKVVAYQSTHRP